MNQKQPQPAAIYDKRTGGHVTRYEVRSIKGQRASVNEFEYRGDRCNLVGRSIIRAQQPAEGRGAGGEVLAQMNSMRAISAPSPRRGPSLTIRV